MSTDRFDLTGKVALVTGASKGLGRAMALGLAKAGCGLALCARDAGGLRETRAEAEKLGVRAGTFAMDVLRKGSVREAVDAVVGAFGKIHILVKPRLIICWYWRVMRPRWWITRLWWRKRKGTRRMCAKRRSWCSGILIIFVKPSNRTYLSQST